LNLIVLQAMCLQRSQGVSAPLTMIQSQDEIANQDVLSEHQHATILQGGSAIS